jgi:hypothetical protein
MKKLFLSLLSLVVINLTQAQTVEEVINNFIEANGGKERLNSINSIQIKSTLVLEQMGMNITIITVREKDKLFRIQTSSPMGGNDSYTVINDTAGYRYVPAMNGPMGSVEESLTPLSKEEFVKQAYQKDCAGYFAQLVDYAAKGSTAVLDGKEKVNDVECDKVKLTLKTGQEMTFYISQANSQVKRVKLNASIAMEMMGMSGMMRGFGGGGNRQREDRKIEIDYEKYKIFDGYPFPTKQKIQLGPFAVLVENNSFEINKPIAPVWYKVQ